jgi:(1->4)-alpha-D-glucan 1-alpha-D-glucosylmutase
LAELDASAAHPAELVQTLLDRRSDGRVKLYVTAAALRYRREHAALFRDGSYTPVVAVGTRQQHVCAFVRSYGGEAVLVVVPRLLGGLLKDPHQTPTGREAWDDTSLILPPAFAAKPDGRFRDLFTGNEMTAGSVDGRPRLPLATIFAHAPVAWLSPVS